MTKPSQAKPNPSFNIPDATTWPFTHIGLSKAYIQITAKNGVVRVDYDNGFSANYGDPEEKVRAEFYCKLREYYQYPCDRMEMEVGPTFKRPHYPADIVIYKDDAKKKPFAVIECKLDAEEAGYNEVQRTKLQLEGVHQAFENSNLTNPDPDYFGYYSHCDESFYEYGDFPKSDIDDNEVPDLPVAYGKPPKHRFFKEVVGKDKNPCDLATLRKHLKNCHQIIWHDTKRSSIDAFHEMVRILYTIIEDENRTKKGAPYIFQYKTGASPNAIASDVRQFFSECAQRRKELFEIEVSVFDEASGHNKKAKAIQGFMISDIALAKIVRRLQSISFVRTEFDAKGTAFEAITSPIFRGEYGGYFTPRTLVQSMIHLIDAVKEIDPKSERFIDPACGSGGMLIELWKYVKRDVIPRYTSSDLQIMKDSTAFAAQRLYGIEIVPDIAQVAMINMILRDDGSTNIELGSGVAPYAKYTNRTIQPGIFDGVISNPPFGDQISDKDSIEASGVPELDGKKSVKSAAMFLLRAVDLLSHGGRCAIILPDSILNNPSDFHIRDYVRRRARILAIISLPVETFMSSKATINTSIIVFKREDISSEKGDELVDARRQAEASYAVFRNKEIKRLKRTIDRAVSDELKKRLKTRLGYVTNTKWKRLIEEKTDAIYREARDYNIFLAEAKSVGINATGRECSNILPDITQEFGAFLSSGSKEQAPKVNELHTTATVHFREFSRWDTLYYQSRFADNMKEVAAIFGELHPLSYYFDISHHVFDRSNYAGPDLVKYLEISDVNVANGSANVPEEVLASELPSRATWILDQGDLLIGLTRPYRGAITVITVEQSGWIATSGFLVLKPRKKSIRSEFAQAFLRSRFGIMQMEREMTGGSYPAIGRFELMERVLIPAASLNLQHQIAAIHAEKGDAAFAEKQKIISALIEIDQQADQLADAYRGIIKT